MVGDHASGTKQPGGHQCVRTWHSPFALPMTPYRFQRQRKRGWRKPPGGICCDRSSRWGNPFDWQALGRIAAVEQFEAALYSGRLAFSVDDVRSVLRGHPLGCFCALNQPCHVDILLHIANSRERQHSLS
jgi:hypothetical protein